MDITDVIYDVVRNWILKKRNSINRRTHEPFTWDEIYLAGKQNKSQLEDFLANKVDDDDWPEITVDLWKEIVKSQKEAEEDVIIIGNDNGAAIIHDGQDNGFLIPQNPESSWQCYKRRLFEKDLKTDTVDEIERATLHILKRLNADTTQTEAVKGMVVGNVQSGKTANMAALMAMAADWGWNMFIVLSGTIESLRIQTYNRLVDDLVSNNCNLNWYPINRLSLNFGETTIAPHQLKLNENHRTRYFTVCLKNSARLRSLIQYLQHDVNVASRYKILVIEDEADQGSINTADIGLERTRINELLCNLVNGKKHDGTLAPVPYKSMNYIGYTATPYANILNEAGRESLYPKDFIATLKVSKEYFGPQQIFGYEDLYDGLDIIRTVGAGDLDNIKDIHDGVATDIPQSLKDAICWFICGAATQRYWGYKKPVSMLIHTSQRTIHHDSLARAIESWITNTQIGDILKQCNNIWDCEVSRFSLDKFKEQYPDYGRSFDDIRNYPNFNDIIPYIYELLNGQRISSINIDNANNALQYHKHIHLCIDNSIANKNAVPDEYVRLVYPNKIELENLDCAPAFIVIGGATLSRGLTIEGLISTYFLRAAHQADTLMQMGRWFGYREGYELLPRIWMTTNTIKQFEFLSILDQVLRDEFHMMAANGFSPAHYGPKVNNSPKLSFLRIVASNRMQASQPADMDYSGSSTQTYLFDNDVNILTQNLDNTRTFLQNLGTPEERKPINSHAANSYIWRGVSFDMIKPFLEVYHFQTRQSVFNDINTLIEWVSQITQNGDIQPWNVVLVGAPDDSKHNSKWNLSDTLTINKVVRSEKIVTPEVPNVINIGALRSPKDMLSDIDLTNASASIQQKVLTFHSRYAMELRTEAGLVDVPQMLVYIIDKDSKARDNSKTRKDLTAPVDIAGLCINIPGASAGSQNVASLHIQMPADDTTNVYIDNGDLDGTAQD